MSQAEEIRRFAIDRFIKPSRLKGERTVSIRAGDVARDMHLSNRMPAITGALGAQVFEKVADARLMRREGPQNGANLILTFDLTGFSNRSQASSNSTQQALPPDLLFEELEPHQGALTKVSHDASAKMQGPFRQFSDGSHHDAVLRRRIKFVVEKGAIARLFAQGVNLELQQLLFRRLQPSIVISMRSIEEYDSWLEMLIQDGCWTRFCRNIELDRWAYVAKLINIVIYEIVSNRELIGECEWQRIRSWIHLPLDSLVFKHLQEIDPEFPIRERLQGMTAEEYRTAQAEIRRLADRKGIPPIWFEDAYSS